MSLPFYTTSIAPEKTIGEITGLLVRSGARQIMTTFDDEGYTTGLAFAINTPLGSRGFKLPVNKLAVLKVMQTDGTPNKYLDIEQAERTAWRIIKGWLVAQLALIETQMVTFDEVMLPYMQMEGDKTAYELYTSNQLPALER
jgi:hypothetical protein